MISTDIEGELVDTVQLKLVPVGGKCDPGIDERRGCWDEYQNGNKHTLQLGVKGKVPDSTNSAWRIQLEKCESKDQKQRVCRTKVPTWLSVVPH